MKFKSTFSVLLAVSTLLSLAAHAEVVLSTSGAAAATTSGITALTGDVTATGPGSATASVAAIQGVAVGTPTGTGNVVFSASPTFTGTISGANEALSGTLTSGSLTVTGNAALQGTTTLGTAQILAGAIASGVTATTQTTTTSNTTIATTAFANPAFGSTTTSAYAELPSGIYVESGQMAGNTTCANSTLTFPHAFPTRVVGGSCVDSGGAAAHCNLTLSGTTTANIIATANGSTCFGDLLYWVIIGY